MTDIDSFIQASRTLEGHLRALELGTESTVFKQWSIALKSIDRRAETKGAPGPSLQRPFVSYALTLHSDKM